MGAQAAIATKRAIEVNVDFMALGMSKMSVLKRSVVYSVFGVQSRTKWCPALYASSLLYRDLLLYIASSDDGIWRYGFDHALPQAGSR